MNCTHYATPILALLLGNVGLAFATYYTYDPQASPPYNDLQALVNEVSNVASTVEGIVLEGDWNQNLVITNRRTTNWYISGTWTGGLDPDGKRVAQYLDILDSVIPTGNEGKLSIQGGWVGLLPGYGGVQDGPSASIGAANVEFDGMLFRGQDVLTQVGQNCQRTGYGGLVELEGHATTGTGDTNYGYFDGVINGCVDFLNCRFDFRFTALSPCQAATGFLANAIQATDAKVRILNPILPTSSNLRFQNGFIEADASLVHLAGAELEDLAIVTGGTVSHPAAVLTASGTLVDGDFGQNNPQQIAIIQSHFTGCGGGHAGAVWIDGVTGSGDYAGVQVAGPGSFNGCTGTVTGALHIADSELAGVGNIEFVENTNTDTAGQSAALTLDSVTGALPVVGNCLFQDNASAGNAVAGALAVHESPIRVADCDFYGNYDRPLNIINSSAQALSLEQLVFEGLLTTPHVYGPTVSTPSHGTCVVRNLLSLGYTRAMELSLTDGGAGAHMLLDGVTLVSSNIGLNVVNCDNPLDVKNTNLVCGIGINIPEGDSSNLTLNHVNADGCGTVVSGTNPQHTVIELTFIHPSSFVGTGTPEDAYQLRWDSDLLDIGVGTGTGSQEFLDYDFDYTDRDIGYKRAFPVTALSGTTNDLGVGWYTVANNTSAEVSYHEAVPHGSVFRVGENAELQITGSATGAFEFGSAVGERTVIAPADRDYNLFATAVKFFNSDDEHLELHGTLMRGLPDILEFENCTVRLDATDGVETVDLAPGGGHYRLLNLDFTDCAGEVTNYDFRRQFGSDIRLRLFSTLRSSVSVRDCIFDATDINESYTLLMEGRMAGVATEITDCTFDGSHATGYPIRLIDTQVNLERNLVDDVNYLALHSYLGSLTMDHNAQNKFKSEISGEAPDLLRLVFLHDSPTYLECGGNSFVYNDVEQHSTFDFVFYKGKQPMPPIGGPDWSNYDRNFWGSSCSVPVITTGRVPSWADTGTELTACPTSVVCDDPSQLFLLTSGQELEDEGEFTGAMSTYEELILGYPDSPEAFTAAQRVKAIAFAGRVERSPEDIQALASAVIESESILPAYLKGVAECLRAWQGDRETAETNLEAQIASASHESDAAVAAKNLLELNTYSGTGGLAQLTTGNSRIRRDARQALFAFDSESFATHGESETSSRPGTLHVEPAYPNPFNPTTTVRLSLGTEAPLTVSIWNLAGQKVTVLHQGNLAAGEYEFQWNAEMHSSGVYLLRAETPGHAEQQKLLLIK